MRQDGADEFMKEDFSVGEYLSKILTDAAGECSRIKDSHVRILSKHTEALAEELMDNCENVEKSLRTVVGLSRECRRVAKELPELFLPLVEYDSRPSAVEEHRKFAQEMQTIKGGKALVTRTRVLKYKEHVQMVIDKSETSGKILITNDTMVICVKKEDEYEMYNALLLQEMEAAMENGRVALSLPPVYVEVVSGEHSSLHKLYSEIEKTQRKRDIGERLQEEETEEEIEKTKEEYNRYLLRIGKIDQIEELSVEELVENVKQAYSATREWKYAKKIMKLIGKKDPGQAFELFCALVEEGAAEKMVEIVHRREKQEKIVEKMAKLLRKEMETVQALFEGEEHLNGNISLYLERLHIKAAEVYTKHLMAIGGDEKHVEDSLGKMRETFKYDGYNYEYTVDIAQKIRKEVIKKRYAFSKRVVQSVFENMC